MNWKQAINPWGYARGLEVALDSEKDSAKSWREKYDEATVKANEYRLQALEANGKIDRMMREFADAKTVIDDLDRDAALNLTRITELNDALRIANERADKNAAACDAAHDAVKLFGCDVVVDNSLAPGTFKLVSSKVGATPKDTFQTSKPHSFNERPAKVGAIPKRTATAPGGAELHLKPAKQNNKAQERAYAKYVKENAK